MFVLKGKINVCAHICTSTCLYVYVYRKMDYMREREGGREVVRETRTLRVTYYIDFLCLL